MHATTFANNKRSLHGASDASQSETTPTFIVGSVRSGTTLLRLMLDHHPEIAFHFEFEFAVDCIGPEGHLPSINDYHKYLRQDRVFLLSGGQIDPDLDYTDLVQSFLDQRRERAGKQVVGATVHHGFEKLPYVWPEARYIHLSRDGRDVARSCIAMGWAGNMYCAADRWVEAEKEWRRMAERLPANRKLEVRYEDLIERPEETLTAICRFMGVEFSPLIYQYAEHSTYDLPDPKLLGQWRRKISERELQLAEARMGDMLVERGYPLSGLPLITVGRSEERRLRWEDWRARSRFRRNRYGASLFATDFLARRLGIRPLAEWCKRRTDAIDNRHLR
ncbi:Sulfotransferase domain protein [Botrimarina colliarenosi]|uniref:Sulfotransferase domain protein n=1 Tax=Botrimarina colliarenosi TaxID=2528001 RepID=A0A5C6ADV5_9BACT|nr:sulfotransferase [Botrimarina colliarenosi]TWT97600.1 Sulfotransferase domain protein [Botrimarina colliarenosi]